MATSNISKRVAAEAAPDLATGLVQSQKDELAQAVALAEAEKRIEADAIPEGNKILIRQRIKCDQFNTLERYVELTPSMCDIRDCGWDAAREAGATDWNNAPVDQVMADGKTFGERLIAMKEYHKQTGHTHAALNDHIVTSAELARRAWGPGQSVQLVS